jgi:thiol:disulfide interchange protein
VRIAAQLLGLAALAAVAFAAPGAEPIYPDISRAKADIEAGLKEAKASHKRVLVDFGGNWCTDCKVLDINFKKPENDALLKSHYVLVHVNVGEKRIDENLDIGQRYGIPLKKGVPALAVLDSDGRVLHAQKEGEFGDMRKMDPKSVNEFLVKWQAPSR